jgi:hypothetical protein
MSDDRAGSRVAAVLEGLALQGATGELEIDGRPGGAIYLDRGEIVFARSAWSPDLATRLQGTLGATSELRDLLAASDQPAGDLGRQLVAGRYLTTEDLQTLLRSVVLDAVIVLTVPLADDASVANIRLISDVSHWAESFCRLSVASVRAEAIRRAGRMGGFDLSKSGSLELRDLESGLAVLSREQWEIAGLIDGTASARDLAWDNGLALYETIECVSGLVRAGLCTAAASARPGPERQAAPAAAQPRVVSGLAPGRVTARGVTTRARLPKAEAGQSSGVRQHMPRRRPAAIAESAARNATEESRDPDRDADGSEAAPVSVDSLRRVLDGLRRLS